MCFGRKAYDVVMTSPSSSTAASSASPSSSPSNLIDLFSRVFLVRRLNNNSANLSSSPPPPPPFPHHIHVCGVYPELPPHGYAPEDRLPRDFPREQIDDFFGNALATSGVLVNLPAIPPHYNKKKAIIAEIR